MPVSLNPDSPLDIDALDRELKDCACHEAYLANFTRRHAKRLLQALAECRAAMEPFGRIEPKSFNSVIMSRRHWMDLIDVCQTVNLPNADKDPVKS